MLCFLVRSGRKQFFFSERILMFPEMKSKETSGLEEIPK